MYNYEYERWLYTVKDEELLLEESDKSEKSE